MFEIDGKERMMLIRMMKTYKSLNVEEKMSGAIPMSMSMPMHVFVLDVGKFQHMVYTAKRKAENYDAIWKYVTVIIGKEKMSECINSGELPDDIRFKMGMGDIRILYVPEEQDVIVV